jgi:hypothetical protein
MASYIILNDSLIAYAAVALILTDLTVRVKREPCSSNLEFESSLKIYLDAETREKWDLMK